MFEEAIFRDRVTLITGGGTGLGRAFALRFSELGASVMLASRDPAHLAPTCEEITARGGQAGWVQTDVRVPEQVENMVRRTLERFGRLDILVNNAAGNFLCKAEKLTYNGWRAVVESVLTGTFHCSREFGRRHIAAGAPGSIINIGAAYAWTGGPGFAHSAAAKAGVKNLTETLAVEWGPYGIRVNALVPGLFPHEDEVAAIRGVPERGQGEDRRVPAGRVGRPRELGWAATFLASPFAAYITGHTLVVDGANWQRRAMLMPEFVPIREQLGKGPFSAE